MQSTIIHVNPLPPRTTLKDCTHSLRSVVSNHAQSRDIVARMAARGRKVVLSNESKRLSSSKKQIGSVFDRLGAQLKESPKSGPQVRYKSDSTAPAESDQRPYIGQGARRTLKISGRSKYIAWRYVTLKFVCLSVRPSVCLSVRLSVCPSVCLSVRLSVCPSVCLCPSVCIYLFVFLQTGRTA